MKCFPIVLLLIASVLFSCNDSQKEIPTIDIQKALNDRRPLTLSDIATDIEYVRLKTPFNLTSIARRRSPKAIVGDNIILVPSKYYNRIFVFDRFGNYINDIEPGSSGPIVFDLSPNEKLITVSQQSNLFLYTIEGELIGTGPLPSGRGLKFFFIDNNHIAIHRPRELMNNDGSQIIIYNNNLEAIDSLFFAEAATERETTRSSYPKDNFVRLKNKTYFRACDNDTLFQLLTKNMPKPIFVFNFGNRKRVAKWTPLGDKDYFDINSIAESEDYFITNISSVNTIGGDWDYSYDVIFYEKGSKNIFSAQKSLYSPNYSDSISILDDMDGSGYYDLFHENNNEVLILRSSWIRSVIKEDTTNIRASKDPKYIDKLTEINNSLKGESLILRIVHFDKPSKPVGKSRMEPSPDRFMGPEPFRIVRHSHQWGIKRGLSGQTYDPSDDSFWVVKYSADTIEHRSRTGELLPGSFAVDKKMLVEAITYCDHDNTFWLAGNRDNIITHYDIYGNNLGDGFPGGKSIGGIAYDPTDSTLWTMDWDEHPLLRILHYNTKGEKLKEEIDVSGIGCNNGRGLTYDPRDSSLWIVNCHPNKMIHVNKKGEKLPGSFYFNDSLGLPDGVALDTKNYEFWIADYSSLRK